MELLKIVAQMMDKEPAKRHQTPSVVADALEPFVGVAKLTAGVDNSPAKIDTQLNLASPSRDTSVEISAKSDPSKSSAEQESGHMAIPPQCPQQSLQLARCIRNRFSLRLKHPMQWEQLPARRVKDA